MTAARALLAVLILLAVATRPWAAGPVDALAPEAERYGKVLAARTLPGKGDAKQAEAARARGEAHLRARRAAQAVAEFEGAVARGLDTHAVWLGLALSLEAQRGQRTDAAAYAALQRARTPAERSAALLVIARQLDRENRRREAVGVYAEALALAPNAQAAARMAELKRLLALRVQAVDVASESDQPRICLRFNAPLTTARGFRFADYLRVEPAARGAVEATGGLLCVGGVDHGQVYRLTVRAGLPAESGDTLEQDQTLRVAVRDRSASVAFQGPGYILPQEGSRGVPLTAINVEEVELRLLRINDRGLVDAVQRDVVGGALSGYEAADLAGRRASEVWTGTLEVPPGERNTPASVLVPVGELIKERLPGVYALIAAPKGERDAYGNRATQWVLVSDIGLLTWTGEDGLTVAARSLAGAAPMAGLDLRLYARNNAEIARIAADADGVARFPSPLLRGRGGDAPAVLMAYGDDGDFTFLNLARPAFDLSDRGVAGRKAPGPLDAFVYTDRGVYRPGEAAELVAMLRDDRGTAVTGLPLTLRLVRPDGVEAKRLTAPTEALGALRWTIPFADRARTGKWTVEVYVDPKAPPVGRTEIAVEDIAPPTIEVAVEAGAAVVRPHTPLPIRVTGRFFYGAPAAGLGGEADAVVQVAADPFPMHKGYRFGGVEATVEPVRIELALEETGADGTTTATLALDALPDTTRPLEARIRAALFEPGGRPVARSLTLPVAARPFDIGIRAEGDGTVAEGQTARFQVIAVDRQGVPVAADGLTWTLVSERWTYHWYNQYGDWRYRLIVQDRRHDGGTIDVAAAAPATLARTLSEGRWRLDIADARTGARTSYRFRVGWWVGAEAPDTPDRLEVTLDRAEAKPGETIEAFLRAPFAGAAIVAVATNRIHRLIPVTLPAEGARIAIPVGADWGPGAYVVATALRPAGAAASYGPGRAVGVGWFGIDQAARTLTVAIAAPELTEPRRRIEAKLAVAGLAPGAEAYLTLAAVDEGVLRLTDFATPAPDQHYFGRRRLGVDLRDLYGRLIEGRAGMLGRLRSGGDDSAERNLGGLPRKTIRIAALFSGIVRIGADGTATVPLDIPDFQGRLRLMAVAWSAGAVGMGEGSVTVRDPVVSDLALPRFLAVGDRARARLTLHNLDGAAGPYRARVEVSGAVRIEGAGEATLELAAGARGDRDVVLLAERAGEAGIRLTIDGPRNFRVVRDWKMSVRPGQIVEAHRTVGRIEPGQTLRVGADLLAGMVPGTGEVALTVSPRPSWDVTGLLRDLDRYPYGCVEQTTSVALPLLYLGQVADAWQTRVRTEPAGERIAGALQRLADMQQPDGSFGLWGPLDEADPWLTAYVLEFFARARDLGQPVSDVAMKNAADWLAAVVNRGRPGGPRQLAAHAYAHYALARAGRAETGAARYFHDVHLAQLPTALAKAQIGAAMALVGDGARAAAGFSAATAQPSPVLAVSLQNYGSELRDRAGVLALAAEAGVPILNAAAFADDLAQRFAATRHTSTQEKAWLLLAAHAIGRSGGTMAVSLDGGPAETRYRPLHLKPGVEALEKGLTVANRGDGPAWRTTTAMGVPVEERPAETRGFVLERAFHRPDGTPADLAGVRQNDTLIVVVSGERADTDTDQAEALVVDLIPAGFELENARLAGGRGARDFGWLPELTEPLRLELRDDRFVAAFRLTKETAGFTIAYVLRAVTPGRYVVPASTVEDMYRPDRFARTGLGAATVAPAR